MTRHAGRKWHLLVLFALLIPCVVAQSMPRKRYGDTSLPMSYYRRKTLSYGDLQPLPGELSQRPSRQQQENSCSLCGNYTLSPDVLPHYPHLDPDEEPIPKGLSCQDFAGFAQEFPTPSVECYGFKSGFLHACCSAPPLHECETTLRTDLLNGYDAAVMPANATTPGAPLSIEFHLDFYHISDLDVQDSTVEIFVWVWLVWKDDRLVWDTDEHCAFSTTFRASLDAERTEIWVPDVDLYNQQHGVQKMPEAFAEVFSDGTVYWRRNGGLKALCLFSGLRQMPFDTLGCRYLFGVWTRMGQVNLLFEDEGGFAVGDFLAKYAEYRLVPDRVKVGYMGISKSGDPADGLYYDFYFERAQRFYVVGLVIPAILFTILSFGMFLLDLRVGERLSYGMALLLVLAAHQIVTTSYLPVTNERLWAVVLINASFYWVVFGLLESVFVGYLFFTGYDAAHLTAEHHGNLSLYDDHTPRRSERVITGVPDVVLEDASNDGSNEEAQLNGRSDNRPGVTFGESVRSVFTLKQSMMSSKRDTNTNRKLIRAIDKWSFRIVPLSYFIFLVVFFATLPLWEESGEDIWAPANEL